jgi:hypothetical protein
METAMVRKLAQIPPEIWTTLPLDANKCLLNERKFQQQDDDKMKKSLAISESTAAPNEQETSNAKSVCKSEKYSNRGGTNQGEH